MKVLIPRVWFPLSTRKYALLLLFFSPQLFGAQQSSVVQNEITWHFDRNYEVGQFANGDYWVIGPVVITRITPDSDRFDYWEYTTSKAKGVVLKRVNGWQVNPSPVGSQAFDENIGTYDATLMPSLPYTASPGQSIVKSVSGTDVAKADTRFTSSNDVRGINRLITAGVLTVLERVPPNGGSTIFRPPYVGSEKPLYNTTDMRTHLLPSLPPSNNSPTLAWIADRYRRVQLDHFIGTGSGVPGSFLRPQLNMDSTYQPNNASSNGAAAVRLMLNDSLAAKQSALTMYVQYGIDLYHFILNGQRWASGFGVQPGSKLPLVFAATVLGDPAMKQAAQNANFFTEHQFLIPGKSGLGVWGGRASESTYWNWVMTGKGTNFEHGDPYGLIDGGLNAEQSVGPYQNCCLSQPYKGAALAVYLMPDLRETWDQDHFLSYTDRWVDQGILTQPDICAPAEGVWSGGTKSGQRCTTAQDTSVDDGAVCVIDQTKYRVTFGPMPSSGGDCHVTGDCICIEDTDPSDGIGRFPFRNGERKDGGGYRSSFVDAMWLAHRPSIPALAPVMTPSGGAFKGKVDVELRAAVHGGEIRYTSDGSNPTLNSSLYREPIRLLTSQRIRARTYHPKNTPSGVVEGVFTIAVDNELPILQEVVTLESPTSVWVVFNKALSKQSAENYLNYKFATGASVLSAKLMADEKTVQLTTTPMEPQKNYELVVGGVSDLFGNLLGSIKWPFTFHNFDPHQALQGYWNFNNDPSGVAVDNSTKKRHGVVQAATWAEGYRGKGMSFVNGSRVLIGDGNETFEIDPTNEFTIAFWVKVQGATTASDEIIGREGKPFSLYIRNDGKISSSLWDASTETSDAIVPSGPWVHVALTYGPTGRTLYINGIRDAAGSDVKNVNLYFPNTRKTNMGGSFVGMLDEVFLYNKALRNSDVHVIKDLTALPLTATNGSANTGVPGSPVNEMQIEKSRFNKFKNVFDPRAGTMAISFDLIDTGLTLEVRDRNGRVVRSLFRGDHARGAEQRIEWDGRNDRGEVVASGIYLLVLKTGNTTETKKIVVLK